MAIDVTVSERAARKIGEIHVERAFAERGREGRSWEFLPFGRRTPRHGSGDQAVKSGNRPSPFPPFACQYTGPHSHLVELAWSGCEDLWAVRTVLDRKPPLPFVWFAWHNA